MMALIERLLTFFLSMVDVIILRVVDWMSYNANTYPYTCNCLFGLVVLGVWFLFVRYVPKNKW